MKTIKSFNLVQVSAVAAYLLTAGHTSEAAVYNFNASVPDGVDGSIQELVVDAAYDLNTGLNRVGVFDNREYRGFVGFDLQPLSLGAFETVTGATLSLTLANFNSNSQVAIDDFGLQLFSYPDNGTISVATLRTSNLGIGVNTVEERAFDDLGAGNAYGNTLIDLNASIVGATIDIPLSASALTAITNSAGQADPNDIFVLGITGTLGTPVSGSSPNQSIVFNGSTSLSVVVTGVPEPGTWGVILSVILAVGFVCYRRRMETDAETA